MPISFLSNLARWRFIHGRYGPALRERCDSGAQDGSTSARERRPRRSLAQQVPTLVVGPQSVAKRPHLSFCNRAAGRKAEIVAGVSTRNWVSYSAEVSERSDLAEFQRKLWNDRPTRGGSFSPVLLVRIPPFWSWTKSWI